ncbi:hypothetical protein [Amycolatopsis sp. CA-230715]|uniref:hypothetical protein n=1 Tax=Amycolatopsis sp. CA-230715 TaxID=2745196 RepID=UPI001C009451|nr:hypothetical protein [Amycolatopsis sp. CA-230715]QWF79985.1 hypothetical protein HUW46_03399 [Amycolatopsis sp. CA-230715]
MALSRKIGALGVLTAATAAIALSTVGTASASWVAGTYHSPADCQSAGNWLAQQGRAHYFHCDYGIVAGQGPEWTLVVEW